jgi:hypothetical protein
VLEDIGEIAGVKKMSVGEHSVKIRIGPAKAKDWDRVYPGRGPGACCRFGARLKSWDNPPVSPEEPNAGTYCHGRREYT